MSLSKSEARCPSRTPFDHIGRRVSPGESNELLSQICSVLLDRLSRAGWEAAGWFIANCIASGDFHTLCDYDPDVLDLDPADVYVVKQCLAFFSKRADIQLDIDRRKVAREKFLAAERACRLTNECFLAWRQGRFQFRPRTERILHSAQVKIASVLGRAPALMDIPVRFGPGASTQTPKKNACVAVKATSVPACSTNLSGALSEVIATLPGLAISDQDVYLDIPVHYAKLAFVPKTSKTDRAICVEPALNGLFQLGLGDLMAQRLRKKAGIDIRDQSANQRAALYGSISGASATLDLSSASDTVSLGIVDHLFPDDWASLFRLFRSAEVLDVEQGAVHNMEKVSSMGNGFTFPLETLLFWAIAESTVELYSPRTRIRTLVYGDDIIVDSKAFAPLCEVLSELGFTPNPKKSFATGAFRESCGADYVSGTNVRPVFVSDSLDTSTVFVIHNFFVRRRDFPIANLIRTWIAPHARLYGPDGFGDGHLLSQIYVNRYKGKDGKSGFSFETYTKSVKSLRRDIAQRYASRHSFGRVVYHHPRVKTLAVYMAYANGSRQSLAESGPYRHSISPLDPLDRCDTDVFTTPGATSWKRTKVYTFETPRLGS